MQYFFNFQGFVIIPLLLFTDLVVFFAQLCFCDIAQIHLMCPKRNFNDSDTETELM